MGRNMNSGQPSQLLLPNPELVDQDIHQDIHRPFWRFNAKDLLRLGECLLFVLGVTFFSGGFGVGGEDGNIMPALLPKDFQMALRYLVWILSIGVLLVNWRIALQRLARNWPLVMLLALLMMSGLWSIKPEITNPRLLEVWQMACFGLFVATRFTIIQQLKLFSFCFCSGAFLSLIVAIVFPSAGRHILHHIGAFKGIYDYKNTLGSMMIMGMVTCSLLDLRSLWGRIYRWGGFALCFLLMLLSTSKTSLILTFGILALVQFYQSFRWRGRQTVIFFDVMVLVGACASMLVLENWVALVSGLGKDPTMSGRTKIWGAMLESVMKSPWLGFGRSTFWAEGSALARHAGDSISYRYLPPHGHNGYLDLMMDVGVIGLALFVISFVIAYRRSLALAYSSKRLEDYWPVAFLTFLAMNNMTESFLMRIYNVYWPMYMAIALSLPSVNIMRQRALSKINLSQPENNSD
jgi:exopolysaccharide production protein ExoQ